MPMTRLRIVLSVLLLLALTASPTAVRADDPCMASDEEKNTKAVVAEAAKAEKSGKPAELFLAYHVMVHNECIPDNLRAKARASLPKLGRDLAAKAEAKGLLYSKAPAIEIFGDKPPRVTENASAFAWLEAAGDYNEANRVMLKAVHARSEDLAFFKTAWDVDYHRPGPRDPRTGEQKPYVSPRPYYQELQKIASANADRLMKAEEKDAAGLSGNATAAGVAAASSLDKLGKASEWMKFLPDGDKPARARAEQRGDAVLKRADPTFTQGIAKGYYEFAGSAKAREKLAQLEKRSEESARAMEKSAKSVEGAIRQKSETEQKKFQKGKADLEKELGF
jgi:hypothetical protein